jgi:hypothetical protein
LSKPIRTALASHLLRPSDSVFDPPGPSAPTARPHTSLGQRPRVQGSIYTKPCRGAPFRERQKAASLASTPRSAIADRWNGPSALLKLFYHATWALGPGWYDSGPLALKRTERGHSCPRPRYETTRVGKPALLSCHVEHNRSVP